MKKIIGLLIVSALFLIAASPGQVDIPTEDGWRGVFQMVILIVIGAIGSPFTQWLKSTLKLEDRFALLLTMVVAIAFAVAEIFLAGLFNFAELTAENFPQLVTLTFSVMTIYYQWLKDSSGIFGRGGLLSAGTDNIG